MLAVVVTAVTAALALLLFGASEYGAQIFPPLWGILAILPAVEGVGFIPNGWAARGGSRNSLVSV